VWLLLTAALTYAAGDRLSTPPPPRQTTTAAAAPPAVLVVPDVRRQAYVFAKGTLEEAGFAWRVEGSVRGYAANLVASQTPAPGTKLIADGMPTIVLRLERNGSYAQDGSPEDVSPYAGRPARVLGAVTPHRIAKPKALAPAKPKAAATAAASKPAPAKAKSAAARRPAFTEPGAPAEPLDEITLVARASRLDAGVGSPRRRTPAAVNHWLYQHNWIVTGASFGWSGGAEALKQLIATDARVQKQWGVGGRSETLARRTLAAVEAKSR
jgi:hypothetical protein